MTNPCTCSAVWKSKHTEDDHASYCRTRLPEPSGDRRPAKAREVITMIDDTVRGFRELRTVVLDALMRAQCDADSGMRSGGGDGSGRGPTTLVDEYGHPVEVHDHLVGERVATLVDKQGAFDTIAERAAHLVAGVKQAKLGVDGALAAAHSLRALDPDAVRKLFSGTVQACEVCTRPVAGTRDDRIRAGRCIACFTYWDRHGRRQDRPKELWDKEDV